MIRLPLLHNLRRSASQSMRQQQPISARVLVGALMSHSRTIHISYWSECASTALFTRQVPKLRTYATNVSDSVPRHEVFTPSELDALKIAFNNIDEDNDNVITHSDLITAFDKHNLALSKEEAEEMIAEVDSDRSGTICWDEFVDVMRKCRLASDDEHLTAFGQFVLRTQAEQVVAAGTTIREVNDPKVIFDEVMANLERRHSKSGLSFPAEIVFLGGAPGSGKGTQTPFIANARQLASNTVVISDLLGERFAKVKAEGALVTDRIVTELLMEKLLEPAYANGVIVDGFPRTEAQVAIAKCLQEKMFELRQAFQGTDLAPRFPRPRFRIVVLYVDEAESVRRQVQRGLRVREHNMRVKATGIGEYLPERPTDGDEAVARRRYAEFVKHYNSIQRLKHFFNFTVINASGSIEDVQKAIEKEFAYQSSQELSQGTFELVCDLELELEVTESARQQLISRLDAYVRNHRQAFENVVLFIKNTVISDIKQHAFAGQVRIQLATNERKELFNSKLTLQMLTDVLAERGYRAFIADTVLHVHWEPPSIRLHKRVTHAETT